MLTQGHVIWSPGNGLVFCCRPSAQSQMQDGSVDKTETYKPLSGKVMLGRWLKWKLCANIYTSLTGLSRICRDVWATYSNRTVVPARAPSPQPTPAVSFTQQLSQTVELQPVATRLWRGSNKKSYHLLLEETEQMGRRWRGGIWDQILWILLCRRKKLKIWNFLIALKRATGGYLSAADRQVLQRLSTKIRFISPPGGFRKIN